MRVCNACSAPGYLSLRRLTEARLLTLFVAAGGRPQRRTTHHLILGDSPWFAGLSPHMTETSLALTELPSKATSVTYGRHATSRAVTGRHGGSREAMSVLRR